MKATEKVLGVHWLVDLHQCEFIPDNPSELERIMVTAAELTGATVVSSCFHHFSPFGLSGVVVIAESHLAVHTWPEHRAICIDLFSCSEKIEVQSAIDHISGQFRPGSTSVRRLNRGEMIGNSPVRQSE